VSFSDPSGFIASFSWGLQKSERIWSGGNILGANCGHHKSWFKYEISNLAKCLPGITRRRMVAQRNTVLDDHIDPPNKESKKVQDDELAGASCHNE
jgi:hypothetical protein